jgi:predicted AAA+ superfamily ATPase
VDPKNFYDSYIRTYIDRDVRRFHGIQKSTEFHRFLQLCAARTGQILNVADLARDADISPHAAREWLAILEQTMQITLLRPYHTSRIKRLVKAPKLYFLDTGLAAYLTHWLSPEQLEAGAMAGAFFETYVVTEILKSFLFRGRRPSLWFFRDQQGHEVDLLIEEGDSLYPVEIKRTRKVQQQDLRGIRFLREQQHAVAHAVVITPHGPPRPFDRNTTILPVDAIA